MSSYTTGASLPEPRQLPASINAEQAVLCAILRQGDILPEIRLTADDFHHPSHKTIFRALHQLRDDGKTIDPVTLNQCLADWNLLDRGVSSPSIAGIFTMDAVASNWREYEATVAEKSRLRAIIQIADNLRDRAYDPQHETTGEILCDVAGRLQTIQAKSETRKLFADLEPFLEGEIELEKPTVAESFDGHHLFYAGRLNEIHGEPGTGKTNVNIAAVMALIRDEKRILYIDPEDMPRGFTTRLRAFGATAEQIRNYVDYLHNPTFEEIAAAQKQAQKNNYSLVVLDGMAESLSAQGFDEDKSRDILPFLRNTMRPFAEAGAGVVISDHVTKNAEGRGMYAKGSGAKAGRYDGVSYSVELGKPYSPESEGFVKLVVAKDRNGGVGPRGFIAAELHFLPSINGRTIAEFREPKAKHDKQDGEWRPTDTMAKIRDYLTENGEQSFSDLRDAINVKADTFGKAIKFLKQDGVIDTRKQGREVMHFIRSTDKAS